MKQREQSIDASRFLVTKETEDILRQFLCPICLQIINVSHKHQPIASNNCPHFFCATCYAQTERIRLNPTCPVCCAALNKVEIRKRHPQLVNILETFTLRCKYAPGCTARVSVKDLRQHEKYDCEFAQIRCIFTAFGCTFKCSKKDATSMLSHQRKCAFGSRLCPFCLIEFKMLESMNHIENCGQREVEAGYHIKDELAKAKDKIDKEKAKARAAEVKTTDLKMKLRDAEEKRTYLESKLKIESDAQLTLSMDLRQVKNERNDLKERCGRLERETQDYREKYRIIKEEFATKYLAQDSERKKLIQRYVANQRRYVRTVKDLEKYRIRVRQQRDSFSHEALTFLTKEHKELTKIIKLKAGGREFALRNLLQDVTQLLKAVELQEEQSHQKKQVNRRVKAKLLRMKGRKGTLKGILKKKATLEQDQQEIAHKLIEMLPEQLSIKGDDDYFEDFEEKMHEDSEEHKDNKSESLNDELNGLFDDAERLLARQMEAKSAGYPCSFKISLLFPNDKCGYDQEYPEDFHPEQSKINKKNDTARDSKNTTKTSRHPASDSNNTSKRNPWTYKYGDDEDVFHHIIESEIKALNMTKRKSSEDYYDEEFYADEF